MMKINIIAIGKIKENSLHELVSGYAKLISKYASVTISEVDNSKLSATSEGDIIVMLRQEAEFMEKHIEKGYIICLDRLGKECSSEEFSKAIETAGLKSSTINFIIGGSHGICQSILNKADAKLSFGKLTYPHKLFRVMLLEQIYRAYAIKNNHPYHK